MPDWKKFRFKIIGRVHDEDLTPLTMPMGRLAEYLTDLAEILGHKDHVHLVAVEDGSTQPVVWIDPAVQERAVAQMRAAQTSMAPHEANIAYRRLNNRLREDDSSAEFLESESAARVIEFPGRKSPKVAIIKPIKEQASITGELRRVGGIDKTIHLALKRADGEVFYVETDEAFAKQLEGRLFTYIRVTGMATWTRDEQGNWRLEKFKAQSFDPEALINEPFGTTIDRLRSVPGNKWAETEDPFEELHKLRHGEDEPTQ